VRHAAAWPLIGVFTAQHDPTVRKGQFRENRRPPRRARAEGVGVAQDEIGDLPALRRRRWRRPWTVRPAMVQILKIWIWTTFRDDV
jgi:hypothetical protein